MSVAVTMMVKDEADIIGPVLDHLIAQGITQILVADNMSEDDTPAILDRYDIEVLLDEDPGYRQDSKMTALGHAAHDSFGCDWILPVDADEVFYSEHETLGEFFGNISPDVGVVNVHGWDHIATDDDPYLIKNPLRRIIHRRQNQQVWPNVAYRWHPDAVLDFGNHQIFNHPGPVVHALRYRHFQYRSFEQMLRKVRQGAAAYAAAPEIHPTYGDHWRKMAVKSDEDIWKEWRKLCEEVGLIEDPCPTPNPTR